MSARDDLADLLEEFIDFDIDQIADMILKAGWRAPARKIEKAEDLEALADETVIRDQAGEVFEALSTGGMDFWLGDEAFQPSSVRLPATVLWEPGDGDE